MSERQDSEGNHSWLVLERDTSLVDRMQFEKSIEKSEYNMNGWEAPFFTGGNYQKNLYPKHVKQCNCGHSFISGLQTEVQVSQFNLWLSLLLLIAQRLVPAHQKSREGKMVGSISRTRQQSDSLYQKLSSKGSQLLLVFLRDCWFF